MTIVMWIRVHPYKATHFVITSTSTCSANTTFWCPSLERIVDSLFNVQFISFTMSLPQSPRLWKFTRCLCIWSFKPILQNKYHTDLLGLHFCSINMTNVSCWQGLYVYIVSKLLRSLYRTKNVAISQHCNLKSTQWRTSHSVLWFYDFGKRTLRRT